MNLWLFVFLAVAAQAAGPIRLQNSVLIVEFLSEKGFPLSRLSPASAPGTNLVVSTSSDPLWTLEAVDSITGPVNIDASMGVQSFTQSGSSIAFAWKGVHVTKLATVDVLLNVTLPAGASNSEWRFSISNNNPNASIGLWQLSVSASGLTCRSDDYLFFPAGYGVEMPAQYANARNELYPSSNAAMQFLAVGGGRSNGGAGVYFGSLACTKELLIIIIQNMKNINYIFERFCHYSKYIHSHVVKLMLIGVHDPNGSVKHMRSSSSFTKAAPVSNSLNPNFRSNNPFLRAPSPQPLIDSAADTTTLGADILLENAGLAFTTYTLSYPIAVGVLTRTPAWFAAATVYRAWALSNAAWLSAGPVSKRADMPQWFLANNVWVNSGWQCYDIFNDTQGDPHVVLERLTNIRRLFNFSMALHYYEWQQGPNPDPAARYRFV
jgi:hypothetical protein